MKFVKVQVLIDIFRGDHCSIGKVLAGFLEPIDRYMNNRSVLRVIFAPIVLIG